MEFDELLEKWPEIEAKVHKLISGRGADAVAKGAGMDWSDRVEIERLENLAPGRTPAEIADGHPNVTRDALYKQMERKPELRQRLVDCGMVWEDKKKG